jgi:hypothetical protein
MPYVYRGKRPLEVECPFLCPGGCGRRLESLQYGPCAVCRGAWPDDKPGPGQGHRSDLDARKAGNQPATGRRREKVKEPAGDPLADAEPAG